MRTGIGKAPKCDGGFTLIELTVAMGVGSIVGVILLYSLVQGVWLYRSNESEMWARNNGSSLIRVIRDDIQTAQDEHIYSDVSQVGGTQTNNGSCAVIDLPAGGGSVTYYIWPTAKPAAGTGDGTRQIYYHSDGATAPNPATDKLMASEVLDFEFRRNANGTVRVGFILGVIGYHPGRPDLRLPGSVESNRVRFTTSAIPRNT